MRAVAGCAERLAGEHRAERHAEQERRIQSLAVDAAFGAAREERGEMPADRADDVVGDLAQPVVARRQYDADCREPDVLVETVDEAPQRRFEPVAVRFDAVEVDRKLERVRQMPDEVVAVREAPVDSRLRDAGLARGDEMGYN